MYAANEHLHVKRLLMGVWDSGVTQPSSGCGQNCEQTSVLDKAAF